jgi:hypothetical protein
LGLRATQPARDHLCGRQIGRRRTGNKRSPRIPPRARAGLCRRRADWPGAPTGQGPPYGLRVPKPRVRRTGDRRQGAP